MSSLRSRPTRGAWIEIGGYVLRGLRVQVVAPHTGRVD